MSGINLNPSQQEATKSDSNSYQGGFSALVKILSSRYSRIDYPPHLNYSPKIGIKWVMESTKGNTFEKSWSTGLPLEGDGVVATISPDGKKLVPVSADCKGYKQNSDAVFLIKQTIKAGFPEAALTDDVSVFDDHAFYIADMLNASWKGSSKKPYPKTYYPQGFDAAKAEQQAARALKDSQNRPVVTQTQSGLPSVIPQTQNAATGQNQGNSDVFKAASEALVAILLLSGGSVKRTQLVAKLSDLANSSEKAGIKWPLAFRQEVTYALFTPDSLKNIVQANSALKLENDVISFA